VAVNKNGTVQIAPNEYGRHTTPSVVHLDPVGDKQITVGEGAQKQVFVHASKDVVYDVKRMLGRHFNDSNLTRFKNNWPFKVVADDCMRPLIRLPEAHGKYRDLRCEEVSAHVLYKMKLIAERFVGGEQTITNAVVTVPAYFNN